MDVSVARAEVPAAAIGALRAACAALGIAALAAQFARAADNPAFHPQNFFSYFTVDSNILAAAVFLAGAWAVLASRDLGARHELARGVVLVCMAATGVVYALLLRETATRNAFNVAWSNDVLHIVLPIAVVLDFVLLPPSRRLALAGALAWLAFPVAWLAYTMIRGSVVDWYPYPFLDPTRHGTLAVIAYCAGIAMFMAALAMAGRAIANRGRR
jgi:FAR-17a/AIG1-like protein